MLSLLFGLVLFLGIHSVSIISPGFRDRVAAKNEMMWKGVYSFISFVGIYFIAVGYGAARMEPVLLYTTPYWLRHVTSLLMVFALILFVAPYFPGKIKQVTKHPQLVAVKLWAASHLLVNGMLADVVLFGAFLAWAVADRISMKKRDQRALPGMKPSGLNDVLAVVIGIALTFAFVKVLHGALVGMPLIS
ncbi:NnrU family protein [Vibrio hannami]|uniref:NnrU family protein n=1 Tax=Vibrio hannami TaxID=2717094 RepID=UPI0024107BBC|nr:NnrU family protein [Vibrio hannami]MDG3085630.1 NnrU family protein [Vibrio hannami]